MLVPFSQVKHLLKPVITVSLFVYILFFVSCSDDAVTPTGYQFDPPRYDWTADTVFADISNIWAYDSNNIYFKDPFKLVYYNGITYQNYDYSSNILAHSIDGYDRNNVFIGGLDITPANLYKPKVIKWNGAGFEDLFVGDSTYSSNSITSIKAVSPIDVWMGTRKGRVYKYENGFVNSYYFDTNMIVIRFLKDANNSIYFFGGIEYYNLPNPDSIKQFIYKFSNNKWENVYYKLLLTNDTGYDVNNIGTDICGMTRNAFYTFNGNSFNYFLSSEFLIMSLFNGPSLNNFLCSGDIDGYNFGLFNWNSKKWSNENISFNSGQYILQGGIHNIGNTYYCVLYNTFGHTSIVLKGKPKLRGGENKIKYSNK
jgi:hypothetical protein